MTMEALVVFTSENNHWLGHGLHPQFRHVYCVLPTADKVVTEINLTSIGIQTKSFLGTPREIASDYMDIEETTEVAIVPYDPADRHLLPHMLNNCVGLTKQLLGIRYWSLTPYQLFKQMEKHYAF